MSHLHRAWASESAIRAALEAPELCPAGQRFVTTPAGPQTADDWHRAISQPTPAMRAAWARLQDSLARARAGRAAPATDHPKD